MGSGEPGQIGGRPHQCLDVMAARGQLMHEVGTNKPRSSGNKTIHQTILDTNVGPAPSSKRISIPWRDGRFIPLCGCLLLCYLPVQMRTVEAIIQPSGEVRLVEPVRVLSPRRALVTILEEEPQVHDPARLSEAALAEDWNRSEEDAAWAYLQPDKSS